MVESGSFRVELHSDGEVTVLGLLSYARRHFRALDPYLSKLTRDGAEGWLMLVDELTDEIVARRRVVPRQTQRPANRGPRHAEAD